MDKNLIQLQKELKAPKNQKNEFGGYKYRSAEDILEAVKPLLDDEMEFMLSDELLNIGDRYYIKATVLLKIGEKEYRAYGYAREAENKKGMDVAQITGAASSYARKYALNGLFAIADNDDPDKTNQGKNGDSRKEEIQKVNSKSIIERMNKCETKKELKELWVGLNTYARDNKEVLAAKDALKKKLDKKPKEDKSPKKAEVEKEETAESVAEEITSEDKKGEE